MWQHYDVIHTMRMEELRAQAARERRWRRQDLENGRRADAPVPGRVRVLAARGIAAVSRGAGHLARRLDARVAVDLGPERLLRDA
jgi:hypothetical protein